MVWFRGACVRCPFLRVDPAQMPRLDEIRTNLGDRLQEAKEQGRLGEVAAIETTLAAAAQKLEAAEVVGGPQSGADHWSETARCPSAVPHSTRTRTTPVTTAAGDEEACAVLRQSQTAKNPRIKIPWRFIGIQGPRFREPPDQGYSGSGEPWRALPDTSPQLAKNT